MNKWQNLINKQIIGRGIIEETAYIDEKSALRGIFGIGHHSAIMPKCWITNTLIGNYSIIEKNTQIGTNQIYPNSFSNHFFAFAEGSQYFTDDEFHSLQTSRFFFQKVPLTYIGDDVRIGENSVIHSGVNIGDGALIYPYSVITEDIEPYAIVMGNPAKTVGYRFDTHTIQRLTNLKWTKKDLSQLNQPNSKINYLDIQKTIKNFEKAKLNYRTSKDFYINTKLLKVIQSVQSDIAILGPSHVQNWINQINHKKEKELPHFMYGESGLSIYSKSFQNFLDWWILNKNQKAVVLVPDFRIGNAGLTTNNVSHDLLTSIFIEKSAIDEHNDYLLKNYAITQLDALQKRFGNQIKFIFWCLYGREQTNIKHGKYIQNGIYQHPIWNYAEFVERYNNNIIDIGSLGSEMLKIIEPDNTIHPTTKGYEYLAHIIQNAF